MSMIFFRCVILYFSVILAVRLMGKRQIGELQPSELVVTILISELAAMPMQDLHLPILFGLIPIFSLVALELLVSVVTLKSVKARVFLYGKPLILVYRGKFRQREMARARVTVDDIFEVMRNNGIVRIEDVDYAVLETNGQLSVIQKGQVRPICADDLKIKAKQSEGLPTVLIIDGRLMAANLRRKGYDKKWLEKTLREQKASGIKEIFLLTVDDGGEVYAIKKESV